MATATQRTTPPKASVKRTAADQAAREAAARTPKTTREPHPCGCGCDQPTLNRFRPGHDAILKSRLIKMACGDGGEKAPERRAAEKRLGELGWTAFLAKARELRAARAERAASVAEARAARKATAQPAATNGAKAATKSGSRAKTKVAPSALEPAEDLDPTVGQAVDPDAFDDEEEDV